MTDALGQISSYGYDNASRLMQAATSNGYNGAVNVTTSYTYNAGRKPLSMNDAPGSLSTNYTYDGFNRVTKVANPNGTVQYGYDGGGNRVLLALGRARMPAVQRTRSAIAMTASTACKP